MEFRKLFSQQQQKTIHGSQIDMSATSALESSLKRSKKTSELCVHSNHRPMISSKGLKRPHSSIGLFNNFDMSSFKKASQQVEDSIAFPTIEWNFNDSDSEEILDYVPLAAKRRCRGLVRSNGSVNLSSFFGGSSTNRSGSSGSLC